MAIRAKKMAIPINNLAQLLPGPSADLEYRDRSKPVMQMATTLQITVIISTIFPGRFFESFLKFLWLLKQLIELTIGQTRYG